MILLSGGQKSLEYLFSNFLNQSLQRRQACFRAFAHTASSNQKNGKRRFVEYEGSREALRPNSDPGSWAFSPEWMGGGPRLVVGAIILARLFLRPNQHIATAHLSLALQVWVTRHYASKDDSQPASLSAAKFEDQEHLRQAEASSSRESFQEWRVLRFNEETRQSVARISCVQLPDGSLKITQRPDCMAFLYMKTLAAAVASLVGLAPKGSSLAAAAGPVASENHKSDDLLEPCRVLCIGLGGGTLPLFLAHHFPGVQIDVVEIDPVVIAAAQEAMGFPRNRKRIQIHEADAVSWLRQQLRRDQGFYDLAFIDAFDGDNAVPDEFTNPEGPFLRDLAASLHSDHGALLVNLHRGELPSLWTRLMLKMSGKHWLDPFVAPLAEGYRDVLLGKNLGVCYILGVGKQYNSIVVAARGQHLTGLPSLQPNLQEAAVSIATKAHYRFPVAQSAILDYTLLPVRPPQFDQKQMI